jgi:hypothetical protein
MSEMIEHDESAPVPTVAELHTISARAPVRRRLAEDVAAFMARGGRIDEVPKDVRADPPRRQDNIYGRGAI